VRPADPNRAILDPRAIVREQGPGVLAEALGRLGRYRIQDEPLEALVESLDSEVPLLLEGNRGSGKSAMADALVQVCNLPKFHIQANRGIAVDEILFSWDRESQRDAAKEAKWTAEHLVLGEVLGAFDHVERTGELALLQIDEIDKFEEQHQDTLLGLFQDGYHDVPRLTPDSRVGIRTPGRPWPIVVLTSNNRTLDRDEAVTIPLRSRCAYCWIPDPSPIEEIRIMKTRVPGAPDSLLRALVKLVDALRGLGTIADKPGLRETIRLLTVLHGKGLTTIDQRAIERHLCHVAKNRDDSLNVRNASAFLARAVALPNARLDGLVDEAFSRESDRATEAVA
jgi:MoxR-like ATPase